VKAKLALGIEGETSDRNFLHLVSHSLVMKMITVIEEVLDLTLGLAQQRYGKATWAKHLFP
jgi:hypothetical protein